MSAFPLHEDDHNESVRFLDDDSATDLIREGILAEDIAPVEDPVKEVDPTDPVAEESAKESAKDPAEDPAENPAENPADDAVEPCFPMQTVVRKRFLVDGTYEIYKGKLVASEPLDESNERYVYKCIYEDGDWEHLFPEEVHDLLEEEDVLEEMVRRLNKKGVKRKRLARKSLRAASKHTKVSAAAAAAASSSYLPPRSDDSSAADDSDATYASSEESRFDSDAEQEANQGYRRTRRSTAKSSPVRRTRGSTAKSPPNKLRQQESTAMSPASPDQEGQTTLPGVSKAFDATYASSEESRFDSDAEQEANQVYRRTTAKSPASPDKRRKKESTAKSPTTPNKLGQLKSTAKSPASTPDQEGQTTLPGVWGLPVIRSPSTCKVARRPASDEEDEEE